MRAFQLLPGISGSNETSAGLYVRGGTPDQNLILFDGMTIYHVDHFYGFFSAFNANSVDDVELHKGGFPAEFGGKTSSVLDINDVLEWGNIGASTGWQRKWSETFQSDLSLSYSNYFSISDNRINLGITDTTGASSSIGFFNSYEDNNVKDYSLRLGNIWNISEKNRMKIGAQITHNDISYEYTQNDTLEILNRQDFGNQYAFYLQDEHTFFDKLKINAGLRSTYYDVTDKLYFEPRLSAILKLPHNLKLKGAVGLYNQYISRTIQEDVRAGSRDFWILSDDINVPVSSAIHYIAGIEWEPSDYLFGAEFFYKDMSGLSEFSMRYTANKENVESEELFFQGDGTISGFEFLAQKKMGKTTGWLAYTYSSVIHTFPEMNNGLPFYALHDQTHEFKAIFNQQIGKWDLSATWIYATGTPYTAPEETYELTLLDGTPYEFIHVSNKNAYRLPDYHRLDISGKYNFNIGKTKASLGLSIFNVYNHENIWYRQYENDDKTGQLIETSVTKLGITPNLSLRVYLR